MKRLYLLALLTVTGISASAQNKLGFSYSLGLPQQEMHDNIRPVHSLNTTFLSRFKCSEKFFWGIEAAFGQYAYFNKEQDIRFPDGSGFTTEVTYSSNVVSGGLIARYNFLKGDAKVNPYLTGKMGVANFYSKVFVHDPHSEDDCKPLEKKTPINDVSFYASYGAGVQIDISGENCSKQSTWFDISVSQLHGTKLDYINIKDIKENAVTDPNAPPAPTDGKGEPLSVRFINVSTQTIHEHQLAEVYNSPLRMLEIKVGVFFRLGKGKCSRS